MEEREAIKSGTLQLLQRPRLEGGKRGKRDFEMANAKTNTEGREREGEEESVRVYPRVRLIRHSVAAQIITGWRERVDGRRRRRKEGGFTSRNPISLSLALALMMMMMMAIKRSTAM